MLSTEQVESFEREGYLVVPRSSHNLANLSDLQNWTDEVLNWPLNKGEWMIYDEVKENNERQVMRTEKIVDYHEGWKMLLAGRPVLDMLKTLNGRVRCTLAQPNQSSNESQFHRKCSCSKTK